MHEINWNDFNDQSILSLAREAEVAPIDAIWLDMDGVIADWSGHVGRTIIKEEIPPGLGWNAPSKFLADKAGISRSKASSIIWRAIDDGGPEWWANIPILENGLELYAICRTRVPCTRFLTSVGGNAQAAAGKLLWLHRHRDTLRKALEDENDRYGLGKTRKELAVTPAKEAFICSSKWEVSAGHGLLDAIHVLVDDKDKNIVSWQGHISLKWPSRNDPEYSTQENLLRRVRAALSGT